MVTKKDLVIAVLATVCLMVTLFSVISSRSSPRTYEYNPWMDVNDDGKIDMRDFGYIALTYGTTGDSTKNVSVTSYSTIEWSCLLYLEPYNHAFTINSTKGYRQITIVVRPTVNIQVQVYFRYPEINPEEEFLMAFLVENYDVSAGNVVGKTYQIQGDHINVDIINNEYKYGDALVYYYLTA